MVLEIVIYGLIFLLCWIFPKYLGIIISIILILGSIFKKKLKIISPRGYWLCKYKNETWTKVLDKIMSLIMFVLGIVALIYNISILK